jgi:hypothetical protein
MVAAAYVNRSSDDVAGKARTEIRSFLQRRPAPRNCNILAVWESIKMVYPHLHRLARKFLALVATSVPSERLFSGAGRIISEDTNRLTADHLSQRVFMYNMSEKIWDAV